MIKKISIILVNYKTPHLIVDCLQSMRQQSSLDHLEIIVVDNDSDDNSFELISSAFPCIQWIQMGYNAGFARANNAGIRQSNAAVVLLLNSDTIIEGDAINNCYNKFIQSNNVACGVQLLNVDRSPQISGNFAMKGGLNYLLPLPYLGAGLKFLAGLLKVKKPNVPEAKGIVEVDWINGAYLMVKKIAIDKAGLLDEDFFLYAEEAEWCSRLKKEGRLCIYGDCNVIHLQGETSSEAFGSTGKGYFNLFDKRGLQIMVSNFLRIKKEFGIGWFFIDLYFYTITIPVFLIGFFFANIFFLGKTRYSFNQWWGFLKNVVALYKYSAKMLSGKPYFYKVL